MMASQHDFPLYFIYLFCSSSHKYGVDFALFSFFLFFFIWCLNLSRKVALNMFTQSIAADYKPLHVYVLSMDTGWISDMHRLEKSL